MEHLFYPQYRGTYIQVDLGAVAHNVRLLKKETAQDRHMLAVVKANAYGHGIVQVARVALENGADYLGVGAVFPTSTKSDADDVSYETLIEKHPALSVIGRLKLKAGNPAGCGGAR